MPFNPKSLDATSLKRLAHRLHEALAVDTPQGQPAPSLSRSQEILAKTFSFQNWNDALKQTSNQPLSRSPLAHEVSTAVSTREASAFQPMVLAMAQAWAASPTRSIDAFKQSMAPLFRALADHSGEQVALTLGELALALHHQPNSFVPSARGQWSSFSHLSEKQFELISDAAKDFWNANLDQDWWPNDDPGDAYFYWGMLMNVTSQAEVFPEDSTNKKKRPSKNRGPVSSLNKQLVTTVEPHRVKQAWMACFSDNADHAIRDFMVTSTSMEEVVHRLRTVRDLLPFLSPRSAKVTSANLPLVLAEAWKEARPDHWQAEVGQAYELFRSERGMAEFSIQLPPSPSGWPPTTEELDAGIAQMNGPRARRRAP